MQKGLPRCYSGFAPVFVVITIAVLIALSFIPIPYYQANVVLCKMGTSCPGIGWHLGPSLFQRFKSRLLFPPEQKGEQITQPTETIQTNPTPKVDETASWKTYTSLKAKFSIKYPENWRVESTVDNYSTVAEAEQAGGNHFAIWSFQNEYKYGVRPIPQNELKIEANLYSNFTKTLEEWIKEQQNIIKTEDILINGKTAKKIWQNFNSGPNPGQVLSVLYIEGNNAVQLYSWPYNTTYSEEFDAVVKSFIFIDKNQTIDTANWKIYKNTKYGFSFKYPSSLELFRDGDFTATFYDEKYKDKDFRVVPVKFSISANDRGRDFEKLYAAKENSIIIGETANIGEKVIKIKNLFLDKQKAVQYATSSSNTYGVWTLTKKDNIFIEIYTNGTTEDFELFKSSYDQILSTFKFN